MEIFRLIIAGGRDLTNYEGVAKNVDLLLCNELKGVALEVVSGMARGADALGVRYAKEHDLPCHEFPADWDKYGKSAGYRRNENMARNADGLLAFWDGQSRGTKHMIDIAKRRGLPVRIVRY